MNEDFVGDQLSAGLSADVDAQLQQLLRVWRAQHQLDASRVESIRASILTSPALPDAALSDAWWNRYTQYLNRVLDEVQRTAQHKQRTTKRTTEQQRGIASMNKPQPWLMTSNYGMPTTPDWQPYLKLA